MPKKKSVHNPERTGMQCNHMTFMGQKRRFLIVSFLCTQTSWPIGGCGCWLRFKDPIRWLLRFGSTRGSLLERLAERLHFNHSRRPSGCECNAVFNAVVFMLPGLQSHQQLGSLFGRWASIFFSLLCESSHWPPVHHHWLESIENPQTARLQYKNHKVVMKISLSRSSRFVFGMQQAHCMAAASSSFPC